jgi:hypothetical protein
MAYIGFNPSQLAVAPFATKYFTGDGTTTTFTLDQSVPGANEANVEVFVENVQQNPIDAYTIGGALNNQLIFSEAPVSGAAVYVIHKGEATYNLQPSTGSVTAATLDPVLRNFTVDKFTGDGTTKTFTLTDTPYSANSILVIVDGITQTSGTNYTVSGTTLTFDVAPTAAPDNGSNVTVIHLGFSSGNKAVMDASISPVKLSAGGPSWETTGRVSITGPTTGSLRLASSTSNSTDKLGRITGRPYNTAYNDFLAFDIRGLTSGNEINYGGGSGILNAVSAHRWYVAADANTLTGTAVMTLDSSGQFGIGVIPPTSYGGADFIVGTSNTYQGVFQRATSGGSAGNFALRHARGTASSPTVTVNGDTLFQLHFQGFDGTNYLNGADIVAVTNGTVTTNSMPTDLVFKTTSDSSSSATERMRIDKNGLVTLPYGQIKFPATQNASSDANTLDDYEEGSWTPTTNLLGTITFTQQVGRYVKIGRLVTLHIYMTYSSSDTTQDANVMYVTGLPFTVSSNSQGSSCLLTERMFGVHSPSAVNTFHVQPAANTNTLLVLQNNWNGGVTNASYFVSQQRSCYKGGNQYIIGIISYEAAS